MDELNHLDERWIDAHSVTCAICGELADERRTVNLYEQENSLLCSIENAVRRQDSTVLN